MNTCPTINIAMFGSRSTGKTTFLTSFVGVTPEQGCSLGVSNEETKRYLRDGWQRLQNGDVPPPTPMWIKDKLLFKLCYQVKGCQQDELSWSIKINDYPGKLVEWDNPSDTSSFGNAWENENQDTLSLRFKEELKKHIQNADAILFLAPIDIQTWSSSDQKLYMAYINDIIHIAKETRDNYSRSIPFCLALMKWDMTGIKAPTARISMDSEYIVAPQVEAYLKQNPVFQKIHSVIDNLNNDRVAVFAASAFGGHLSTDNTKPDPEHLEPYNILPILFWMCSKVEQNRLIIMNREIERISLLPDCHEKFEQIAKTYQTALEQGINDRTIIKEIEQKLQANKDKHIEFTENEVSNAFQVIEQDKRCWNPSKEKRDVLKKQLQRGLYKLERKRELEHDIADLSKKARKTDLWIGFCYFCTFAFILLVIGAGVYGVGVSKHSAEYANAESLLPKDDNNVTSKDIDTVKEILDGINPFVFENYLPTIKGKRESLQNRINGIIAARKKDVDAIKEKYGIQSTDSNKDKLDKMNKCLAGLKALPEDKYSKSTCGLDLDAMENDILDLKIQTELEGNILEESDTPEQKKIKLEASIACIDAIPKSATKGIIEKYQRKRASLDQQLKNVTETINANENVKRFQEYISYLNSVGDDKILSEIENCQFTSETSIELYNQLSQMKKEAEKRIVDNFNHQKGALQDQESSLNSWEFTKQVAIKKQIRDLCTTFSGYFPKDNPKKNDFDKEAKKLDEEINPLQDDSYIQFEQLYRQMYGQRDDRIKLKSALEIQDNKDNLPKVDAKVWEDLKNEIAQCVNNVYNSYVEEIGRCRDSGSLSERLRNCQERDTIVSNYLEILPDNTKERKEVENQQKNDSELLPKLQLWSKFENEVKQLNANFKNKKATVSDCVSILENMDYNNPARFEGYDSYKTTIEQVQEIKTAIERIEEIQKLCKNFDEFERDYNPDDQQYQKTFADIKKWKNDLNKYNVDPEIADRISKLSDIEKKNNEKWEDDECKKFSNVENTFDNSRSVAKIDDVIKAAKDYLEKEDSPKAHKDEILKQQQAYNQFKTDLTNNMITITLNSYKVVGTGFNNNIFSNNLDFKFSLGGIPKTISLTKVSGEGDVKDKFVSFQLNNSSILTFELVNVGWKDKGAHDSVSINLLDHIFSRNVPFKETSYFKHQKEKDKTASASATITISGLPIPPKPLVLGSTQVQVAESESEEDDLIQLPSLDF